MPNSIFFFLLVSSVSAIQICVCTHSNAAYAGDNSHAKPRVGCQPGKRKCILQWNKDDNKIVNSRAFSVNPFHKHNAHDLDGK